jgi:hypothetical protein
MRIKADLTQLEKAKALGRKRQGGHSSGHKHSTRTDRSAPAKEHQMGVLAELMLSSIFRKPLDEEVRPGGDGGVDFTCRMKSGKPVVINVKARAEPWQELLIKTTELKRGAIYVLAHTDLSTGVVDVLGCIPSAKITHEKYPPRPPFNTNLQRGERFLNHVIPQADLVPFEALLAKLDIAESNPWD